MKRIAFLTVLCVAWLIGCNKDDGGRKDDPGNGKTPLMDGSIIINQHPDVKITSLNAFPVSEPTGSGISPSRKRMGMIKTAEDGSDLELRANDYRFKEVAKMSTLKIDGVETQATHVKITDNYAFVSYNEQGDPHRGGVVVYRFTIHDGTLDDVTVDVEAISGIEMPHAELSAIDYYNGKLYMTGASSEPEFGYNENKDGYNYAFFMVMELNADKTFNKDAEPVIQKLTSFQGTSIRVTANGIFITTGDGTNDTKGGLYIFKTDDCSLVKFIDGKDNARSADVDASNIYLMQAEPARVTKYDLNGNLVDGNFYLTTDESMQHWAKSEILAWEDYLFVAENESGLRMLLKDGTVNASLDRPGEDKERHVTNSVCMNSDPKKNDKGDLVQSNLLLLANGEKGIYWYDVMKGEDDKDYIVSSSSNSILGGPESSANFIASRGNIVFLADGLGGLKVLYVGFNSGPDEPPVNPEPCDDFASYLYQGISSLLPDGRSVFRNEADPIIQTLFSNAVDVMKYIEVLNNNTKLYVSFLFEDAGWNNALGYFVIPQSANAETDAAEYAYYESQIRPNLCTRIGNANVLKDEYIIFQNLRSGNLREGIYQIGGNNRTFNAGDKVVLFMVPDGWRSQNNRVEVTFGAGAWDQIFFTHQGINLSSGVSYYRTYREDFRGIQHNAFTAEECNSIVMFFEDNHNSSDTDYNDVVIAITDNVTGALNTNIKLPKYTIKVGANGRPEIVNEP